MAPEDIGRIRAEAHVSAVFSLQHDDCHTFWGIDYEAMCRASKEFGLEMRRCPIRDFDVPDMRRNLPSAISSLARLLHAGHRTYVHCTAGLGRAPLTVLGSLILIDNYSAEDAIQLILNGRPDAVPAWEAFYGACHDMEKRYRHQIERRAYDLFISGVHPNALEDWTHAKFDILREVLTCSQGSMF